MIGYQSRLGDIDLIDYPTDDGEGILGESSDPWWFRTRIAGFDLGSPEAEQVIHASLLLDGDDVESVRWRSRTITLNVEVCAFSSANIPSATAALRREIGHRNVWTWCPHGVKTVSHFTILTSTMRATGTQLEYLEGGPLGNDGIVRVPFELTLTAFPWAQAATEITETFTAGAADTAATLDECTSLARWPGADLGTYNSESVVTRFSYTSDAVYLSYSDPVPAAPYIFVDVAVENGVMLEGAQGLRVGDRSDSTVTATGFPVAVVQISNGFTRYVFTHGDPTARKFFFANMSRSGGMIPKLHITRFGTMSALPPNTLFALQQQGSVRVPARLRIGNAAAALGEVFVYADPTMLSHGWNPDEIAQAPEGDYVAYIGGDGRLGGYAAGTTMTVTINGQRRSTVTQWTDSPARWFPVGPFHLGGRYSRRVGSLTYTVEKGGAALTSPKPLLKLFREGHQVQLLHARSISQYLFVEPPSLDNPLPGIYSGTAADGSNATSVLATVDSEGYPILAPCTTALYVDAATTDSPSVEVRHRPAYDGLAAS